MPAMLLAFCEWLPGQSKLAARTFSAIDSASVMHVFEHFSSLCCDCPSTHGSREPTSVLEMVYTHTDRQTQT